MAPLDRDATPQPPRRSKLDRVLDRLAAGAVVGVSVTGVARGELVSTGQTGILSHLDGGPLEFDADNDGRVDVSFAWRRDAGNSLIATMSSPSGVGDVAAPRLELFDPLDPFTPIGAAYPAYDLDVGQLIPDSVAFTRTLSLGLLGVSVDASATLSVLALGIDSVAPSAGVGDGAFFEIPDPRYAGIMFMSGDVVNVLVPRMGWAEVSVTVENGVALIVVGDVLYETQRFSTINDGDFSLDGRVDAADYTRWRDAQAAQLDPFNPIYDPQSDPSQDGFIGGTAWQRAHGAL